MQLRSLFQLLFRAGMVLLTATLLSSAQEELSPPDPVAVSNAVTRLAAEFFSVSPNDLRPDMALETTLYADAQDMYELYALLGEQFSINPPPDLAYTTLRQLTDWILQELKREPDKTLRSTNPPENVVVSQVYYATNRRPTENKDVRKRYGKNLNRSDQPLSYGRCEVWIPSDVHQRGAMKSGEKLKNPDPKKYIVLKDVVPLEWSIWTKEINACVAESEGAFDWSTEAFVLIHGFNVSFDKAARRAAQVAYDFEFPGIPMVYSWPSNGSPLGYSSDRYDAKESVPYLKEFLLKSHKDLKVTRLHIIAHSMGHQVLLPALKAIAEESKDTAPLFGNIVFAAPDFNRKRFGKEYAAAVQPVAERITLYTSENDKALSASSLLNTSGRLGKPVSVFAGIETVDVSDLDVAPWNTSSFHGYFASKEQVIDDLIAVIHGVSPQHRELQEQNHENSTYWLLDPKQAF